jgi:hypothetical protein
MPDLPDRAFRRIVNPDPEWQQHIARRHAAAARRTHRRATACATVAVMFAAIAFYLT